MPIPVICPGCKSRFTVGDQFAGKTGPCPKCKTPIKIPTPAATSVVIHEPEPSGPSAAAGRPPTAPIKRRDKPVPVVAFAAAGAGAIAFMGLALLVRLVFPASESEGGTRARDALLFLGGFAAAVPCVLLGYAAVRNRDLEPYRGQPLLVRALTCAVVYAGLWGIRGLIPWLNPALQLNDMYQWFMVGPLFVAAGALTALASLDLEWGPAAVHFSFYVLFTALLRSLAGLPSL